MMKPIFCSPQTCTTTFHSPNPTHQRVVSFSLVTLLGLTSGIWGITVAIAPALVHAYTSRVAISLDREPGEEYSTLIRRAEAAARAAAQRSFDSDILVTDVSVTIIGEHEGAEVPLMLLEVTRDQWRSRPDPQRWATYFLAARSLLRLDTPAPDAPAASVTTAPYSAPEQSYPENLPASADRSPLISSPPDVAEDTPESASDDSNSTEPAVDGAPNPVQIDLPAAPGGQLGLPRSILQNSVLTPMALK